MVVKPGDFTLSVVIPAYNEAENIKETLNMITNILPTLVPDYEIIVIDDGSKDSTGSVVREIANKNERINIIYNEKNCGKGASLISGFTHAKLDWVLFTDADLQINISELIPFLTYTKDYDMIAGFRLGRKDSMSRRVFSKIYACMIHSFLGIRIRDINCPFKLIRNSLLQQLELQAAGFFIDTELLYKALQLQIRIKELPVACHPRKRGISTVRLKHVVETVKEMAELKRDIRSASRPSRQQ